MQENACEKAEDYLSFFEANIFVENEIIDTLLNHNISL